MTGALFYMRLGMHSYREALMWDEATEDKERRAQVEELPWETPVGVKETRQA
jgi:hypothetical protein